MGSRGSIHTGNLQMFTEDHNRVGMGRSSAQLNINNCTDIEPGDLREIPYRMTQFLAPASDT